MKVNFMKLSDKAVVPTKAHSTDAGFDLVGVRREIDRFGVEVWHTDLAVEIPEGYVGYIFPRSSISKKGRMVANGVGVVDSGYTGEITVKMHCTNKVLYTGVKALWKFLLGFGFVKVMNAVDVGLNRMNFWNCDGEAYNEGDRIGQLIIMPIPDIEFVEVKELSESERGNKGYGSTGD